MAYQRIEINGKPVVLVPDSLNWQQSAVLAKDGQGAPIFAPYYGASLGISLPTNPRKVSFDEWIGERDAQTITITLPHPSTGVLTTFTGVYVDEAIGRMDMRDDCAVMTGFDIVLSRILVVV